MNHLIFLSRLKPLGYNEMYPTGIHKRLRPKTKKYCPWTDFRFIQNNNAKMPILTHYIHEKIF